MMRGKGNQSSMVMSVMFCYIEYIDMGWIGNSRVRCKQLIREIVASMKDYGGAQHMDTDEDQCYRRARE